MRTFHVETKDCAPFEVKAENINVTSEACIFGNSGNFVVAVIPLANLLYVTQKDGEE
jgi:hypothetical protein